MAIEFKNNPKPGIPIKKGKKGKKSTQKKSKNFFLPNALKRPGSAKLPSKPKPLPEWNEDNY
jgi:hypothetical protein